jgi:hypothetical protein
MAPPPPNPSLPPPPSVSQTSYPGLNAPRPPSVPPAAAAAGAKSREAMDLDDRARRCASQRVSFVPASCVQMCVGLWVGA